MTEKSDNITVMYTPNILKYTVTFQPNNVGSCTPDKIVFKNVSQLLITMTSTGKQCQIREGGGIPSRKRRTEQRKMNLLNDIKEDENKKEEKVATDIAKSNNNIKDENGNAKIEEMKNDMIEHQIFMANLTNNTKVTLEKVAKKQEENIDKDEKNLPIEKDSNATNKNDKQKQEENIEKKENETKEKEKVAIERNKADKEKLEGLEYISHYWKCQGEKVKVAENERKLKQHKILMAKI